MRYPIKTFVNFFDWEKIFIELRLEVNRGGQVYFLHNKIQSIPYQVERLREFFPKEKIEYIHGQQDSRELEKNLLGFFGGSHNDSILRVGRTMYDVYQVPELFFKSFLKTRKS